MIKQLCTLQAASYRASTLSETRLSVNTPPTRSTFSHWPPTRLWACLQQTGSSGSPLPPTAPTTSTRSFNLEGDSSGRNWHEMKTLQMPQYFITVFSYYLTRQKLFRRNEYSKVSERKAEQTKRELCCLSSISAISGLHWRNQSA